MREKKVQHDEKGEETAEQYRDRIENLLATEDRKITAKKVVDNEEDLVNLAKIPGVLTPPGGAYARRSVFNKLSRIQQKLETKGFGLKVFQAWRSPEEQAEMRAAQIEKTIREYPHVGDRSRIEELASRYVAPMEFAPHCTGGAIDLALYHLESGEQLDFGTAYTSFCEESYTEHPSVTGKPRGNRLFLKEILEEEEFFNIPTEWWHYSFGNSEWAVYGRKRQAIYGPVEP